MQVMAQNIIRVRTNSDIKQQVADLSAKLGMNTSTAVNLFFYAFLRKGGLPFEVALGETAKERAEIKQILAQRTKEADDPRTQWLSGSEVKEMIGLD